MGNRGRRYLPSASVRVWKLTCRSTCTAEMFTVALPLRNYRRRCRRVSLPGPIPPPRKRTMLTVQCGFIGALLDTKVLIDYKHTTDFVRRRPPSHDVYCSRGWQLRWLPPVTARRTFPRRCGPSRKDRSSTGSATTTSSSSIPTSRYVLGMEVGFRAPLAAPGRRHHGRHDRPARRRPLDRARREPRLVLAAGLHAAVAAGLAQTKSSGTTARATTSSRHILDVQTGKKRDAARPDLRAQPRREVGGRRRTSAGCTTARPGYGYAGVPDPNRRAGARGRGHLAMDLETGKREPDHPLRRRPPKIPYKRGDWTGAKHWFNHLLFSPDGKRFIFLHRWAEPANPDGQYAPRACSPRGPTARISTCSIPTARPRTSSGAIRNTSWPGPGTLRTATSSTSTRTRRTSVEVVGAGRDDGERPLHLPARQPLDPERHVSGQGAQSESVPVRHAEPASATRWGTSCRRRNTRASGAATPTRASARMAARS